MMPVWPSQDINVFSLPHQLTFGSLDSITISYIAKTSSSQGQSVCHSLRQKQQAPLIEGVHLKVEGMPFDDEVWTIVT